MSQYKDRLAAVDDDYKRAPTAGSDELPPDGNYQAVIDRFDFIDAKSGRLYLKTDMTVASGEHRGWKVVTLHDLEDREKLQYLKAHLRAIQVEDSQLSSLEDNLQAALDAVVEVEIYTTTQGRQFANVTRRHKDPVSDIPNTLPEPMTNDDEIMF